jgi:hypothetical protein
MVNLVKRAHSKADDFDIFHYEILVFLLEDLDKDDIKDMLKVVQWMLQTESYSRFCYDRLWPLEVKLVEELERRD